MRTPTGTKTRTEPIRVGLYTRLSYSRDGDTAGVDRQEKDDRALAKLKRWTVAGVYCDNSRSASDDTTREEFERLLVDITEGRVDAVIVWHLDRLVRQMKDLIRIIEAGRDRGLNIACVHGISLDLGDPTGVAVAQILCAIAEMEVKHKAERQTRANMQRAEAGKPPVTRCFGYNQDGSIREPEGALVRQVFERFAAGAPITELAKFLTSSGLRAAGSMARKSDGNWHRVGVRSVLKNPRYVGQLWHRGEYVREGNWTPLVDPDLFAAVQAKLEDPTRTTTSGPARRYLGSGLYVCSVCGKAVLTHTTNSRGRSFRYYLCKVHGDLHVSQRLERVDDYVKREIMGRLNDPEVWKAGRTDRHESAAAALVNERTALLGKADGWAIEQASDHPPYTARQMLIMNATVEKRLEEISRDLAKLGERSALAALAGEKDPGAAWIKLDVHQAGAVVDALCTITLRPRTAARIFNPADVQIQWK